MTATEIGNVVETRISSDTLNIFIETLDTAGRALLIRNVQWMISDALDMAEKLLPVIRNQDDKLFVIVLDECDQRVEALCDGPFYDWRMARTALAAINERLNQQDAKLLAALLEHADSYA